MYTQQIFDNDTLKSKIRTILIDDEPWFSAADVCDALQIQNSRQAIADLDDDEKQIFTSSKVCQTYFRIPNRGIQCVSESGLYCLIFKSIKPEAKTFKRWVTREVLPSIRKTGSYGKELTGEQRYVKMIYQFHKLGMTPVNAAKWAHKGVQLDTCEFDDDHVTILRTYKNLNIDKINQKRLLTRWVRDVRIAINRRFNEVTAIPLRNGDVIQTTAYPPARSINQ